MEASSTATSIWEVAYRTSAAVDLPVQPFNNIVGRDTGQCSLGKSQYASVSAIPSSTFFSRLFQLHGMQFFHHSSGPLTCSFLAPLGVDCLEHLGDHLHFGMRRYREHIAVKSTVQRWYLVSGNTSPTAFSIPRHLSSTNSLTP